MSGPQEAKTGCPWCDSFGWLDAHDQPTSPQIGDHPCPVCNGVGTLVAADLLELRTLAREAAVILAGDCAMRHMGHPSGMLERDGEPGSRWPYHARLSELVGGDPLRTTATATELERWCRA